MFDLDQLATGLRGVIRQALGMPDNSVRPANQNAPTSDPELNPMATVLLMTGPEIGQDSRRYDNATDGTQNVVQSVAGTRELNASVQFFGAGSRARASRLQGLLRLETNRALLASSGLGLVSVGAPKDVSLVVESLWEERAQVDVTLYAVSLETDTLGSIGSVPSTVTLN